MQINEWDWVRKFTSSQILNKKFEMRIHCRRPNRGAVLQVQQEKSIKTQIREFWSPKILGFSMYVDQIYEQLMMKWNECASQVQSYEQLMLLKCKVSIKKITPRFWKRHMKSEQYCL